MNVLVTGGTGSLGPHVVRELVALGCGVTVFSRDASRQMDLLAMYEGNRGVRAIVGDVRNIRGLRLVIEGADAVIHLAAAKHVSVAEHDPLEAVDVNVCGTANVVRALTESDTPRLALLVSTDKAVYAASVYGATKLIAERLFLQANRRSEVCSFSVVRLGNLTASRGSVIPLWRRLAAEGKPIQVTDRFATRFWIGMKRAAEFVVGALSRMHGGEVFVPDTRAAPLYLVADAVARGAAVRMTELPSYEKRHEHLISAEEFPYTAHDADGWTIHATDGTYGFGPRRSLVSDEAEAISRAELLEQIEEA